MVLGSYGSVTDGRLTAFVVGGGEYGTYHARQLALAVRAGRLPAGSSVVVVDRDPACAAAAELGGLPEVSLLVDDWFRGLSSFLASAGPSDHVVPAPYSPHLLWSWLLDAAPGLAGCAPPLGFGLPFEERSRDDASVAFVSAAAWLCPATCVEPAHCPALRAPRDWSLVSMLRSGARERGWEPIILPSLHLAFGIASVPVASLLEARSALERLPVGGRALVATSSHCHAAIGGVERTAGVNSPAPEHFGTQRGVAQSGQSAGLQNRMPRVRILPPLPAPKPGGS